MHLRPYFHERNFLKKPSAREAGELLSPNRNQLRILTGLLTEHLSKHLLVNSPERDRCKQVTETGSRSLWLWSFGHKNIQAPGSTFHETRGLWRHFYQQDTALCSRYKGGGCMIIRAAWSITYGWSAHITNMHVLLVFYSILPQTNPVDHQPAYCPFGLYEQWSRTATRTSNIICFFI